MQIHQVLIRLLKFLEKNNKKQKITKKHFPTFVIIQGDNWIMIFILLNYDRNLP